MSETTSYHETHHCALCEPVASLSEIAASLSLVRLGEFTDTGVMYALAGTRFLVEQEGPRVYVHECDREPTEYLSEYESSCETRWDAYHANEREGLVFAGWQAMRLANERESEAREMGASAGRAGASWCYESERMSESDWASIVEQFDAGDPAIYDALAPQSGWLSGEWAGASIPEIFGHYASERECDAYEEAANESYWHECERLAREALAECESTREREARERADERLSAIIDRESDGSAQAYAYPGAYPVLYITSDGGALCGACVDVNWESIYASECDEDDRSGWRVVARDCGANYEESITCDECSRELSAYYEASDERDESERDYERAARELERARAHEARMTRLYHEASEEARQALERVRNESDDARLSHELVALLRAREARDEASERASRAGATLRRAYARHHEASEARKASES